MKEEERLMEIGKKSVPMMLLDDIAAELQKYQNTDFYTCHCTGLKQYECLKQKMPRLHYLSSGDVLEIK